MYILGVNYGFHDSSASLLLDGEIICAVAEERLTRIKQDGSFPINAIKSCLKEANIPLSKVSHVAVGWNPSLRWKRGFVPFVQNFHRAYKLLLSKSVSSNNVIRNIPGEFDKHFPGECSGLKFHFLSHHECHAASSYYLSGFKESAIMTIDASGEADATWIGIGQGNKISKLFSIDSFNSLGMVYSSVTEYLGFVPDGDEWKVMGLAPYGKATYVDEFNELIKLTENGFKVNLDYFDYPSGGHPFYSKRFVEKFGSPRKESDVITQHYEDIAFAVQKLAERVMFHLAEIARRKTGSKNLCLAGGVTLNSVSNGKILAGKIFDNIFIQPAAGDDGTSLGAALLLWFNMLNGGASKKIFSPYLGPTIQENEIVQAVNESGLIFRKSEKIYEDVADLIADGKIIGWYQGRSEFGPRALGNRSIIADPRISGMKDIINGKVKFRESFRPFAPAIIAEKVDEFFECLHPSPYMNLVYQIRKCKHAVIPAVTHEDGTGRLQTVSEDSNRRFYNLIKAFESKTGVPVLINTSFNVKGEPIVNSPKDAIHTFKISGIDYLVLGDYILHA